MNSKADGGRWGIPTPSRLLPRSTRRFGKTPARPLRRGESRRDGVTPDPLLLVWCGERDADGGLGEELGTDYELNGGVMDPDGGAKGPRPCYCHWFALYCYPKNASRMRLKIRRIQYSPATMIADSQVYCIGGLGWK